MSKANRGSAAKNSYRRRKPQPLFPPAAAAEESRGSGSLSNAATPASPPAANSEVVQRGEYLVQLGIEAYQSRRLVDAEGYLNSALAILPSHALAHNCLGIVRRSLGRVSEAILSYERALAAEPQYAEAHNNLGVASEAIGDLQRALAAYQSAIAIKADFAAARCNLANALTKLGRPEEALQHLRMAIELQPRMPAAHNSLGLTLRHLDRPEEAEAAFRTALELQPAFPEAYLNLGNLLRWRGKRQSARECFEQALRYQPRDPAARIGIGNLHCDEGRVEEAATEYSQVLADFPGNPEAHFGMGNVRDQQKRESEAISHWQRAIELRDGYAEAHNNLGGLYNRQGHASLAEREFLAALRAKPDLLAAHNNLGNLYREQDRMELAAESYGALLSRQSAKPLQKLRLSTLCPAVWTDRDAITEYSARIRAEWESLEGAHAYQDLPDLLSAANEPPYNLQFLHENIRPLKEAYAKIFRYVGPTYRPKVRSGRIRFATVVTPKHEVAFLRLIWSALKRLNPDLFERTIICSPEGAVLLRAALRDDEARVLELPQQPHKVIHTLREQQFDILHYFEICTDAWNYFLPFFRVAPVQVTSWGIQVTSGIPQVDAYLSSGLVEVEGAQAHYSERLARASTLLTFQTPITVPPGAKRREDFGFRHDQNLYFCVQHLGKFHPDFDPLLAGILRADPDGIIVATQDLHGYGAQRIRDRQQRVMPDVADRVRFLPRQAFADYVALANACDVMLDPLHFGGVTTSYDGFSLNKPIVTWPSEFHRGRYTSGCYLRMGVTDCMAGSAEEYVRIAVELGRDRDRREAVSARIRESRWRIFEDHQSVSEHERLLLELVERSRQS